MSNFNNMNEQNHTDSAQQGNIFKTFLPIYAQL